MKNRVHIGRANLRVEMAKKDMTIRELAAASGISRATISDILGGKWCKPCTAQSIVAALGVGLSELIVESA